jgi:hypothetical protein
MSPFYTILDFPSVQQIVVGAVLFPAIYSFLIYYPISSALLVTLELSEEFVFKNKKDY